MKRLLSRLPKVLIATTAIVALAGSMSLVKAWWPNRQTFTMQNPAPYVTFDSITDNPDYGDERTFFDAKNATNTNNGGFADINNVTDGEDVLLRIYVHNDASSNLNTVPDGKGGFKGIATGANVRIELPTATDTSLRANAFIDASNSNPGEVADTTDFRGSLPFSVTYEPGTATMYTNAVPQGFKLSDSIVTGSGAPIGYTGPNGTIPGCMQYTGIVTVKVKVKAASFTATKQVAHLTDKSFSKSITANPGETVYYQIGFTNTGSQQLNNVVIRDRLPSGVNLVPNTSMLFNANHPGGVNLGTDAVTSSNGVNIGDYLSKANAFLQFKATMPNSAALQCGANNLVNTGEVWVNGQVVSDTATVTINKTCQNQANFTCDLLATPTVDNANRKVTLGQLNTTATNGATFTDAVINWGDNTSLTTNNVAGQTHQYAQPGTYTITATAHFNVNGQDQTSTSSSCSKPVTFTTGTTTTTPPTQLVNTGPGEVVGLFGGASAIGAFGYRKFLSRRLSR